MKKSAFRWLAILTLVWLTIIYAKFVALNHHDNQGPKLLPNLAYKLHNGPSKPLSFTDGNKLLIVHLWATWCSSCVEELPQIIPFHEKNKSLGIDLLLLSVNDDPVKVEKLFNKLNLDINSVKLGYITSEDLQKFSTKKIPETAIYDANGVEIFRYIGPQQWNSSEMHKEISTLIH